MAYDLPPGFTPGTAEGTSLLTKIKEASEIAGGVIYATQTAQERLYIAAYGLVDPPVGASNFAKGCSYKDISTGNVYLMSGTTTNSSWTLVGAAGGGLGITAFKELLDTPNDYTGQMQKGVRVNGSETGLEFYKIPDEYSGEVFTTEMLNKLNGIEDGAEVNDDIIEDKPCHSDVDFLQEINGSSTPVPVAIKEGDTSVSIIDNTVRNASEYKQVSNSIRMAQSFNSGPNDTITAVSFDISLVNAPDGDLDIKIYDDNSGAPGLEVYGNSISVNGLSEGVVNFAFGTPFTVLENTDYHVVVGLSGNTKGEVKWNEATAGEQSYIDVNDQWLETNSKLTLSVAGYKKTTGTGGVVSADSTNTIVLGFAIEDTATGEIGEIVTCGELGGFAGMTPYTLQYLSATGGLTEDKTETGVLLGISISSTEIVIRYGMTDTSKVCGIGCMTVGSTFVIG